MSTTSALAKAKKIIRKHIDLHIEELINLQNGNAAIFAICKDLDISLHTDRILLEIAQSEWTEAIAEFGHKKKREGGMGLDNMLEGEKDNYIHNLENRVNTILFANQNMASSARKEIEELKSENEKLRGKPKKPRKNTGLLSRIFAKIVGKDVMGILEEDENGQGSQDQRFLK